MKKGENLVDLGGRVVGWLLLVPQSECTGLCVSGGHWYPAVY